MIQEPTQCTPSVRIQTSAQPQRISPPWLTEAVLLLEIAHDSALLSKMQQSVRVPRGRMGTFEVCDFFLVLLVYAVSGEVTLLALYAAMAPSVALLGALWSRKHLPARCTLSRFLAAVTQPATEALRQLLFEDLLLHGLSGEQVGGLVDRVGVHHVVFDVDGTRQVARQRQVVSDDLHPPVRRRLDKLCAPGYPGRKRGEVVRTRSTVQQSHTSEWLGTFGAAGNGDAFGDLDGAGRDIARYLQAHGLSTRQGLVRLDGLYGHVRGASQLQHHGLGYLMRTADYRLLQDPLVQQVLTQPMLGLFVQPDTGTVREVFEVNALDWVSADHTMQVRCRLVITRCAVDKKRGPRVGKRQGDWALELFVSDREAQGLSAMDLLSLYFARGGFEQTLAQEDQEQDPDRWCSAHPWGQECWQLLSQWVWNVRVRLGAAAGSAPVRRTLWAPAQAPTDATAPSVHPTCSNASDAGIPQPPTGSPQDSAASPTAPTDATAPSVQSTSCGANDAGAQDSAALPAPVRDRVEPLPACPAPTPQPPRPPCSGPAPSEPVPPSPQAIAQGQVAPATGRGSGRFAGSDFVWTQQQQLRCPAGKFLKPRQRTVVGQRLQIRYQARISDCATCPLSAACRGTDAAAKQGRRVTVWAPVPTIGEMPLCHIRSPNEPGPAQPPVLPRLATPSSQSVPSEISRSEPAPAPGEALPPPPPPLGPQPVWWDDLPATVLRRSIRLGVYCQRMEVPPAPPPLAADEPLTRARRAHRRLSWKQRLARNAQPPRSQPWVISLFGISAGITTYLANLGQPPC